MVTIYKEGCKDREMVMRIQKIVGAKADGVWGPKTTAAVKAWQKAHGLYPDGLVGPKTLEKMGLASGAGDEECAEGVAITKAPIGIHITRYAYRNLKYIAIHYTAGRSSRAGQAMLERQVFLNREASADFVVDDETIVQVNPDLCNYYCWSVGDKVNPWTGGASHRGKAINRTTISVEICSNLRDGAEATVPNHDGWYLTDKALDNARRLVRYLMKAYDIPKENVIRHYDATGKLCPGVPGWNDGPLFSTDGKQTAMKSDSTKWKEFYNSI